MFDRVLNMPFNTLSGNPTKWSNTLKTNFRLLPMNSLSVFDLFWELTLNGFRLRKNDC